MPGCDVRMPIKIDSVVVFDSIRNRTLPLLEVYSVLQYQFDISHVVSIIIKRENTSNKSVLDNEGNTTYEYP